MGSARDALPATMPPPSPSNPPARARDCIGAPDQQGHRGSRDPRRAAAPLARRVARSLPRAAFLPILCAGLVAASCGGDDDAGSPASSTGSALPTTSAAITETPASHSFSVTSGSALAVSHDGTQVYVADEDHLALFVVPSSMHEPTATRVVQLPGPPAQIVASEGLVLVTVRTLPTDDARAAYEALRGPAPEPAAVRRLPTSKLLRIQEGAWTIRFWVEKEYAALLDSSLDELPEHELAAHSMPRPKAPPAGSATPGASGHAYAGPPGNSPPPHGNNPSAAGLPTGKKASHDKAAPRRNTPAVPLDPNILRKSQGGLLMAFRPDPERGLVEVGRTVIAPDAWGIGVTPDGTRAVVTSAWASKITVVDLATNKAIFEAAVPREPRGVAVSADGKTAWISHLVGTDLTRVDGLDSTPRIAAQPLPAGPARAPIGTTLSASLGYSAVLSPDGKSLYVPRHAIGADGIETWWGAPVVDVLDIASGKSAVPAHMPGSPGAVVQDSISPSPDWGAHPGQAPKAASALTQPRAAVYRKKTDTLLIASEGWDTLTEVDARAADPAMAVLHTYDLADIYDFFGHYPVRGGAPSAVALSADESTAYVYCRTTFDVVKVNLETRRSEWVRLADDALPADASFGRRLFTNARSPILSGGIACAGCHPEGRDDGYVWREGKLDAQGLDGTRFLGLRANAKLKSPWDMSKERDPIQLFPRQTPMIAGRVRSPGPYGWHAEAANLAARLSAGVALHRGAWDGEGDLSTGENLAKVDDLMDYLRSGLVPPPTPARDLTEKEQRGKVVFEGEAKCSACHKPDTEHTDRVAYPLPAMAVRFGFDDEPNHAFKTPSLRFLAGTAPFYHDGSAATLEDLVAKNGNRMGATLALSTEDKAALVAYLETL